MKYVIPHHHNPWIPEENTKDFPPTAVSSDLVACTKSKGIGNGEMTIRFDIPEPDIDFLLNKSPSHLQLLRTRFPTS